MKGLIIKDLINISKNFRIVGLLILFYTVIATMSENPDSFIGVFTLLFAMYFLMTYSFDEMARWDSYALTMPLSRNNIVQGKYLLMILFSLFTFLLNCIMQLLVNWITKQEFIFSQIKYNALGAGAIIVLYSIVIPVITKFGIEKARIILIVIYILSFILGSTLFKRLKEVYPNPPEIVITLARLLVKHAYIIIPLILFILLGISYMISIRIYRKKEF